MTSTSDVPAPTSPTAPAPASSRSAGSPTHTAVKVGIFGFAFGATLAMIGFGDFAELNAMFTFRDPRMLLAFVGAVVVAGVIRLAARTPRPNSTRIHQGVVPGAVLFGSGWAISGGCPAIPIVQLGTGYLPAVATIAGVIAGMRLYRYANARWFHLDPGACNV